MPAFKLVTLFNMGTAVSSPSAPVRRSAGWSESVYGNFASSSLVYAEAARQGTVWGGTSGFNGLWLSRAALLPLGAAIVGYRIQQVDIPNAPIQTGSLSYPGSAGILADIPQMAMLCTAKGVGVNNIRRFTIRAIPDGQVTEGEYKPTSDFQLSMGQYLSTLNNWAFRAKQQAVTKLRIISIQPNGDMLTELAPPFALGQMVRVTRSRDSGGNLRGGRFRVSATIPTGDAQTRMVGWTYGLTTGGSVTADQQYIYPAFDGTTTAIGRIVTRRVGRPFIGFRGRRSKRR